MQSVEIAKTGFVALRADDLIFLTFIVALFVKTQHLRAAESHCTVLRALVLNRTVVDGIYWKKN